MDEAGILKVSICNRRENILRPDRFAVLVIISVFQLAGSSWSNTNFREADSVAGHTTVSGESTRDVRSLAASTASKMVGTPYRYGGKTPDGFDCSGLVYYAYGSAGVSVPRTSRAQLEASTPIRLDEAEPGELLFFRRRRAVSHVGVYLGGDRFVHAPSTGKSVSIENLDDPYYQAHFVRAGRF